MEEGSIVEFLGRDGISDPLTDLLRKGARDLLQTAVEAELETFLAQFRDQRTAEGRAAVVRNGHHPERAVQTGIGPERWSWIFDQFSTAISYGVSFMSGGGFQVVGIIGFVRGQEAMG